MSQPENRGQVLIETVRTYLELGEQGRAAKADALLGDRAVLVFPGGHRYATSRERAAQAGKLFRWVRKSPAQFCALVDEQGRDGVLTFGQLRGEDLNGVLFEGVRYADLFIFDASGLIVEQHVWNDLAAVGVAPPWPATSPAPLVPDGSPEA